MDAAHWDELKLVGRTVSHYQILEKLGSGGMGVVYKARDTKLDRPVALKFLPPHLSTNDETNARFVREAKAASALDHENICTIYEISETEEGQLFIAMAYYEGQTLKERIEQGPPEVEEALDYAVQMAEGLEGAHEAGIIHRDIKPANVMVTSRGRVKILDFGLAKLAGSVELTRTGTTMGTLAYMSPEQAQGGGVDYRTDIWSFGVVLYEMLAGQRPFKGNYEAAVLYAIVNADPEPVTVLRPDVPEPLKQIVEKALAKRADERYQTIGEVLADLRAIRRGDEAVSASLWQSLVHEAEAPAAVPATAPRVNITYTLAPAEAKDHANLLILLHKVRQFWIEGVLEQSIHGEALIALGKETQPEAIEHPWAQVLELPDQVSRTLPPGQAIGAVFDEVGRSLLILGAPGAGKTITLLDLARALLTRAEANPTQPIPVVFNLSSYADPRQGLRQWLAEELSVKYQVPKKMGRAWLEDNRLVLLLDGLDEVQAEHRAACVEVINAYVEEHGVPGLAICSRLEDYTALPVRLRLSGAIRLQPLSPEQVAAYVARSGEALSGLHAALKQDPVLQTLAQTPLMLDVMTMAYRDVPAEALASEALRTEKARQSHLFETYIERMFRRKGKADRPYAKEQTLGWLTWLARGMQRHRQTVFLIEQLQPNWLATRTQRWGYALSSRLLGGLIFGLILALSFGLFGGMQVGPFTGLRAVLMVGLILGLLVGLLVGLIDGSRFERRRLWARVNRAPTRWRVVINVLIIGLVIGLVYGLEEGLIYGLFFGLIFGLIGAVFGGLKRGIVEMKAVPNQGIKLSIRNAVWGGLIYGLIFGLSARLTFGLPAFLWFGGLDVIQHFTLRFLLSRNGRMPRRYAQFLDYASRLIFLKKVGGGYIFIHRLLLEHFAARRDTKDERLLHTTPVDAV